MTRAATGHDAAGVLECEALNADVTVLRTLGAACVHNCTYEAQDNQTTIGKHVC